MNKIEKQTAILVGLFLISLIVLLWNINRLADKLAKDTEIQAKYHALMKP